MGNNLYLALMHYPVVNKKGAKVTSAITTMDLHDISRASMTFGVEKFFVVSPLKDQKNLANEIISHWTKGVGGEINPDRKKALERLELVDSYEDVLARIKEEEGDDNLRVTATSAITRDDMLSFHEYVEGFNDNTSELILFGTAWGLADELLDECDAILEPVKGSTGYNHLSVRSAVSIILDRITCIKEKNVPRC